MIELTKSEKRAAKDLIRKGILHRHAQWHQELRELLNKPYGEEGNEFDPHKAYALVKEQLIDKQQKPEK